ncbi:DUF998 domain-containing protein [Streptomyces hypolithicus]
MTRNTERDGATLVPAPAETARLPRPRRRSRPSPRLDGPARGHLWWAGAALAAAGVIYNSWVLEFVLPTGLDPRHSYVSELYAADQPYRSLFGGVEVVCAVLVTAGALCALSGARRWTPDHALGGRTGSAGLWALASFGLFSVTDVALPMRCAPSVQLDCQAVHPSHTVTSALVHFTLFASMVLLSLAAREGRPARGRPPHGLIPVRRWGPWVLGCALLSSLATVGPLLGVPGWQGVPQRIHLLAVGVWFVLLGAGFSRRRI